MSEELRRGIPKGINIGKRVLPTPEEDERNNREFEAILKRRGVLKPDEHIEDFLCDEDDYEYGEISRKRREKEQSDNQQRNDRNSIKEE